MATLHAQAPPGLSFFRGDPLAVAQGCAERALLRDPKNSDCLLLLGRILFARGDRLGAEQQFARFQKLRPRDVDTYLDLGRARLEQGDRSGAEECFAKAQLLKPRAVDTYRLIADAWMSVGARETALAQVEKAKEHASDYPGQAAEFATELLDFGCAPEARALMDLSFAAKPKDWEASKDFGSACLRAHLPEEANLWFGRAIAAKPSDLKVRKEVALACAEHASKEDIPTIKAGMLAAAESGFPSKDRDNEDTANLAWVYLSAGEREKAETLFRDIILSKEVKADAFRAIGRACLRTGLLPEAFKAYEAIEHTRSSGAFVGIGPMSPGLFGQSMVKIDFVKLGRKQALGDAAMDLSSKGYIDKALPLMQAVYLDDPEDFDWLLQFGQACLKTGKRDQAALYFSKAADVSYKEKGFWTTLATIHLDLALKAHPSTTPAMPGPSGQGCGIATPKP
ncbi:MAG TPA: tetratricopeptide repeat protein [Geothrix sp.]|nr:tetratricopeptide repeat protein [Geothrix sp.]